MGKDMMKMAFQDKESGSCVQGRLVGGDIGQRRPGEEVVIEFRCELMTALNRKTLRAELMRRMQMWKEI